MEISQTTWNPYSPWTVDKNSASATVRDEKGAAIARCYRGDIDAVKIAAVPDLLNALHEAGDVIESQLANFPDDRVSQAGWKEVLDGILASLGKAGAL